MTEILGVLGFVFALASLGWQVWTWRSERLERISCKLSYMSERGRRHDTLSAHVRNIGLVPVYISDVGLVMDIHEPRQIVPGVGAVQEISRATQLVLTRGRCDPLPPGASCDFCIPDESVPACTPLPDSRGRIEIRSARGKIWTLSGWTVDRMVRGLSSSTDRPNAA